MQKRMNEYNLNIHTTEVQERNVVTQVGQLLNPDVTVNDFLP